MTNTVLGEPSADVAQAQRCGWTRILGGDGAAQWFTFNRGPRGVYKQMIVLVGDRRIEIIVSPTGRSVQVYVDGAKT